MDCARILALAAGAAATNTADRLRASASALRLGEDEVAAVARDASPGPVPHGLDG